ncbi:hypothetical protein [Streptomyces pacificus]|uniref:Uncharacterized protein n=1 Tax=Streptomyces pacificus TaxID=2705029 RepID=A0A6A0AP77_9ACTN|nr:hypothetical protein [Streptomyces pacificus]GFH34285.1 hypothetical protein SCWH03_04990 [Streptomyces pacificus]
MTISYVDTGALSSHADTITPAFPAGVAVGRLAVLTVVSGHPSESIPTIPAGWIRAGTFSGGGGSFASGTGPRRLTFFTRVLDGAESAPSTRIPSGSSGSHIAGRITVLSRSAGTGWRWAVSLGEDTSAGTGFSAACSTALPWTAGDFAILGYGIRSNAPTMSAEAITATGIAFGTITERADDSVAIGHLARLGIASGTVSSGAGTQVPTVAATLSAAHTGSAGVLRIREATASLDATAQTVFPPRNLISVTGMASDDIVTATIERQVGTDRTAVRAATESDVTGSDVLLRIDAEQPFGLAVTYIATLTDSTGGQWELTSSAITSTVDTDVISDAVRGIGAAVRLKAPFSKTRTRDAATFNIGGRLVVVGRRRSQPTTTATAETATDSAGDALDETLADATEGVILIRARASMPRLDGHYAVVSDEEAPTWYDGHRLWTLELVRVEAWPDVLEAAGFTLQDIADNFETLADLADTFTPGTLLDIALFDFGA